MKKIIILILLAFLLLGCKQTELQYKGIDDKYRTFYEVFLYSFADSNGDGIGDINGLINKLDYINDNDETTTSDLNVNGIWLMPIHKSSTYHKYNVDDYYSIDPVYGTLEDFKKLVAECEKRDIHIILDLVLNHSSDQHEWFQSACDSIYEHGLEEARKHNKYVDYYYFVQKALGVGKYYSKGPFLYEANFSSDMPDLNLDNEDLRNDIKKIVKYWLDLGVSGFRLDAVKEYYTGIPTKNIEFLSWLNDVVKEYKEDAYLVGESWESENAVLSYYQSGIDSFFNFAYSQATGYIAQTINTENMTAYDLGKNMVEYEKNLKEINPDGIDAQFFVNHDTARAAGFLFRDLDRMKIAAGINLMSKGTTFIYYGEEIGMSGSGRDENKRAPMQWGENEIMTIGPSNMEMIQHSFEPVIKQQEDQNSLLNYYKKAINIRNKYPEIARGDQELIEYENHEILILNKKLDDEITLVYNISKESQVLKLADVNLQDKKISDSLLTNNEQKVKIKNNQIEIPPYAILILK